MGRGFLFSKSQFYCAFCNTTLYVLVAKVEEESNKKAKQTSEPDEKENGRIAATSEQVERAGEKPSPTPEHRRRKVHTLKLKLPGDQEETRKRRHSSHRRSREEITEVCMKNVQGIYLIIGFNLAPFFKIF